VSLSLDNTLLEKVGFVGIAQNQFFYLWPMAATTVLVLDTSKMSVTPIFVRWQLPISFISRLFNMLGHN